MAQSTAFTLPSTYTSLPTYGTFLLALSACVSGTCFVGHNCISGLLTPLFSLNLQKSGKIYRKLRFKDIECSHLVFLCLPPDCLGWENTSLNPSLPIYCLLCGLHEGTPSLWPFNPPLGAIGGLKENGPQRLMYLNALSQWLELFWKD